MHPDLRQLLPSRHPRLRGLVLVVGEDEVVAAAVNVKTEAENLLGHRRALNVPARASTAPGRVPCGVLARLLCLPERKVERILLQLGSLSPFALIERVKRAVRKLAIGLVGADAEVDVAFDRVGRVALDQRADQVDYRADRFGRQRLRIRAAEAEAVGIGDVGGRHLACQQRARLRRLAGVGGVIDLVVDVGDVGNEGHFITLVDEKALQQRVDDEGARVANVDPPVDGWPAGVDRNFAWITRLERD